jgi:signal transduction histidine kinase
MKVLIADDNLFYRRLLAAALTESGYEVVTAADGEEAWGILQKQDGPRLAIVDWMMPRLDGVSLCRRVRSASLVPPHYLVLLTAKGGKENIIAALDAGADDFISKPFDHMELQARLRVGGRIVSLQSQLASKVDDLENALSEAQRLEPVGRLAAGVAHDFNNLLQVISGGAELLEHVRGPGAGQQEFVSVIKEAAERGASLTRQLLAFSRKQILQPETLQLNDLVERAARLLRRVIGEDIELITRLQDNLGPVKADPAQMEQVIMNLAVNSRDAMPGGGQFVIETRSVDISETEAASLLMFRPGPHVLLAVSDTGCGMDAQTKSHLFEPFFTTKAPGKGTGLGLATVYGIIRQSDGFIHVDSKPGQGTTFRIYLPLVEQESGAAAPAAPQPNAPGNGETILLVEDDDQVRMMLRLALEANQYTVLEARDGEEALQVHAKHPQPIDVLLTDVVMPHMSGHQVADRLTALRPKLKVLFMSGYTDDSAVHDPGVNSTRRFLQKPFTSLSLHSKVKELLSS